MAGSGGCRARSACSGAGSSSGGPGPGLASIKLRLTAMDEAVESGGRRLHPVCPDGQLLDGQKHHASSISPASPNLLSLCHRQERHSRGFEEARRLASSSVALPVLSRVLECVHASSPAAPHGCLLINIGYLLVQPEYNADLGVACR